MPGIMKTAVPMLTDPASPLHIPFRYWLRAAPWLVRFAASAKPRRVAEIADALAFLLEVSVGRPQALATEVRCPALDRKGAVWGKGVAERVYVGGSQLIKTKKKKNDKT